MSFLYSQYKKENNNLDIEFYSADNPRTPLKATAKCTGAVKKGNITLRKEDCGEPLVSQTPLFTEALSNIEGSDQRCSSTTDAEQTFDQVLCK